MPEETYAAFVLTSVGQGYITNIDPSEALVSNFMVPEQFMQHQFQQY
jgi:hypothetical protein